MFLEEIFLKTQKKGIRNKPKIKINSKVFQKYQILNEKPIDNLYFLLI